MACIVARNTLKVRINSDSVRTFTTDSKEARSWVEIATFAH